ncbi:deoxyribodipyrimidine photo-lyase [Formosimonas limnophila]|uniref:Deoxyribodipyrimidine photo-lyase n=1 Tax=Formosimonas limnophila TaxID=1384487 RepID=A0A8J3CIG6_9BURK|nr:deoxyribodipyrimidine photo-lyase [Formosimonas limnophila]GHA75977.1 deoxyribodipyrimidine photo-lyase [Formosimonas limnophila]
MKPSVILFWFRRDLRLEDNAGLYHALKNALAAGLTVQPLFIFDTTILDALVDKADKRVVFIHQAIERLHAELAELGATLDVRHGVPLNIFAELLNEYDVKGVYANRDYEPDARARDKVVYEYLNEQGIAFRAFKDHVIFEKNEVMKADDSPYTVFTPYSRKWLSQLDDFYVRAYPTRVYLDGFYQQEKRVIPSMGQLGFEPMTVEFPSEELDFGALDAYAEQRDYPALPATSRLGVHLRFGTVSIRQVAAHTRARSAVFLSELIWRDFYQMILWHHPQVVTQSFKPMYDQILWRNQSSEFAQWCAGQTGYPLVDAGMRELNETGFMHNRVRMVVASFLTKHLLIDWRWGERYFAQKLLDYDLAANNGGWQWAAGCGCDAAPYFRVFNPTLQMEKFDPKNEYVRRWVPEFETAAYPEPMVEHRMARERCLQVYSTALKT